MFVSKKNRCQSCGMPMAKDRLGGGTEKNGLKSKEFCSYCYKYGEFVEKLNLDQMLTKVRAILQKQKHSRIIIFYILTIIPSLKRWSKQNLQTINWYLSQIVMYLLGCILFSVGAKFFIDSNLGTDPLDVLVIGINLHLHLGMGICSSIVAIGFISWWTIWNKKFPPITPFVTTALVGFLIDLWNYLAMEEITTRLLNPYSILITGLLICSYASSLIIMSGIGIRIMDLVAITMIKKWNWSFFKAKMVLEIGLFSVGWLLGGPVGPSTILFLFIVGPFIQPFMIFNNRWLHLPNYGLKTNAIKSTGL